MDLNYKPPSSRDVAKLPSRKPSPRFNMATNVANPPGIARKNYITIVSS